MTARLALPPPLPSWPATLRLDGPVRPPISPESVAAARARISRETLWWPVPCRNAARPRALALTPGALAEARAAYRDEEIALLGEPGLIDPERLEAVFGPAEAPAALWAALGGLRAPAGIAPDRALAAAQGVSPWTGESLLLGEAIEAQAVLRRAAARVGGRAGLVGMTPWKRRCLAPFMQGADGPPRRAASVAAARTVGMTPVMWGAGDRGGDAEGALRVEDGFLRSVGLGLRHTPPISLVIDARPPYFDATRSNGFDALVAEAEFGPELCDRARRLAERIVALGLTKYNLAGDGTLPDPGGREALLVAGQVATDASVRLGARLAQDDLGLLEMTRARFPNAFLLYKPHPDVVTGLRAGAAPIEAVSRLADATTPRASAEGCIAWADRVVVNTSLIGFEALMRGKAVTTVGRPFYAGWGLTDDVDPPQRPRHLKLDELLAAALILYPSYVDPETRLPATPEIAVQALALERALSERIGRRLRRLWRDGVSWLLNRF